MANGLLKQEPMEKEAPTGASGPPMPEDEGAERAGGGGEEESESNVSPEEQEQYDNFVGHAAKLIYDPKSRDAVLQRLKATGDFMDDLANTAVMVVQRVEAAAEQAGEQIPDEIVFAGGKEILEELADYAGEMGIHDYDEKELEGAWYRALDLYRAMGEQTGRIDPTQLKAEFAQINEADQQGRLGELLPGADKLKDPEQTAVTGAAG